MEINSENPDLFDLAAPPPPTRLEELHAPAVDTNPFPANETLPQVPFTRSKSVEMPLNTRGGKGVKLNPPPVKQPPAAGPAEEDKKSITIG